MTINTGKAERDLESIGLGHNATASLSPVTTRHEYKGWIYRFRPTHNITSPSGEVYELKYAFDVDYVPYKNEVEEIIDVWNSAKC
jgi:hypothetical protein